MSSRGILPWAVAAACVAASAGLAAGAEGGASAGGGGAGAGLGELFAQDDPPAAMGHLQAVLDACRRDADSLRKLIESDAAYEPIDPGWHTRRLRFADGGRDYDVEFTLVVPPTYRPERAHAVLVAAHGQGSNGRHIAQIMLRMLGPAARNYVILAPTMPGPPHFSGKSYQEQAYLRPLAWVRRNLNVDDDRVCVAGYSQGGHCAWHLAALFPRLFAAAVAMAGTPWFEGSPHTSNLYLENLAHLPLWAIWGELDRPPPPAIGQVQFCRAATQRLKELGNTRYRGTELAGVGHGGCWAEPGQFAAFLAAGQRAAAPDRFAHVFHLEHHRRGYYLEALELSSRPLRLDQPIRIEFSRSASDPQGDRAAEAFFARQLFRMQAELDRPNNALTVRTTRIRNVRIYVTEGLFDLSRPVTLRFGSRSWRGQVTPSAACMLKHYAEDRDAAACVLNEIELAETGRAVIRYP